ncbi:MAG: SusD/RagB family nutrient-binding outer membrane lipoprotein, partial [Prevotella shahii]|nr:SusD/RagB family nutrient-binding outer membrane lipoprotein [Hoylesella shahii]
MRNGKRNGKKFQGNEKLSAPTITRSTPYVWMNAAEMWLLRAEGALLGWNMGGTAKDLYEEGVRTSLAQHGLSDSADNYLASTNTPSAYAGMRGLPAADAPSDITPAWDDNATDAKKLERIITQKWIAIYPLGQEAWSEFRRTGYPKLFPVVDNFSNGKVNTNIQVRRVPFPASEYIGNKAEVEKAVQLLGGEDTGGTSLWWDKQ